MASRVISKVNNGNANRLTNSIASWGLILQGTDDLFSLWLYPRKYCHKLQLHIYSDILFDQSNRLLRLIHSSCIYYNEVMCSHMNNCTVIAAIALTFKTYICLCILQAHLQMATSGTYLYGSKLPVAPWLELSEPC